MLTALGSEYADGCLLASMSDIAIICSIIRLGHDFGHRVVAERSESAQVCQLLSSWGCDEGQAYWIGQPMPARIA